MRKKDIRSNIKVEMDLRILKGNRPYNPEKYRLELLKILSDYLVKTRNPH